MSIPDAKVPRKSKRVARVAVPGRQEVRTMLVEPKDKERHCARSEGKTPGNQPIYRYFFNFSSFSFSIGG